MDGCMPYGSCSASVYKAEIVSLRTKIDEAYQLGRQASWDQAQATIDGLRAALACTPSGVPSGVQQSEEIVGLRALNAEMLAALCDLDGLLGFDVGIPESGGGYQFWGTDFFDFNQTCARARAIIAKAKVAALACRPQGESKSKVHHFRCTQAYCKCAVVGRDRFECEHFKECPQGMRRRPQGERSET